MSGALNSILNPTNILSTALNVASMCFPPAAIACSLGNLMAQTVGGAIGQAVQTLQQVAGMPKFVADTVGGLIEKVLDKVLQQSDQGCDHQVHHHCGNDFRDFGANFAKSIVDGVIENMRGEGKKKGAGSWYEALAKALGQALDKQAGEIEKLSGQITNENAKDKPSTMTELQTASQRMSFMMSAADQVLKTLGEALKEMARK